MRKQLSVYGKRDNNHIRKNSGSQLFILNLEIEKNILLQLVDYFINHNIF